MRYQIKLTTFASEIGKQLPPEIKKSAKAALKELSLDPDLGKELQTELVGFRSYRFMRYRIVYKVDTEKKEVVVWAIGRRRDIYENLGERLSQSSPEED